MDPESYYYTIISAKR